VDDRLPPWAAGFPGAITIAGKDGTILYMNDAAALGFEKKGGMALVGSNLAACHNAKSNGKILSIMEEGLVNAYTIEKGGKRRLILQAPWYESGAVGGIVEISAEITAELPHFKRD